MKVTALLQRHERWTYFGYSLVFLGMLLSALSSQVAHALGRVLLVAPTTSEQIAIKLQEVGHAMTVAVAGLAMAAGLVLFVIRRSFDPIPRDTRAADASPLSSAVQLKPAKPGEAFDAVVKFGEEAFAPWGGSEEERRIAYEKFGEANVGTLQLITIKSSQLGIEVSEAIGFSCVLPITEDACKKYRQGTIDSWEFSGTDIVPAAGLAEYFCLNAIYIARRYRKRPEVRPVQIMCHHISRFLRPVGDATQKPPYLVAEGLTTEGRRFLKRYGFESYYLNKDRNPTFQLDLGREGVLSDRAAHFKKCLQEQRS